MNGAGSTRLRVDTGMVRSPGFSNQPGQNYDGRDTNGANKTLDFLRRKASGRLP